MYTVLQPVNSQKSFHGKAHVIERVDGVQQLESYATIVCEFDPTTGKFSRLWSGWSATTAKHINAFRAMFGLPAISKSEWLALPLGGGRND